MDIVGDQVVHDQRQAALDYGGSVVVSGGQPMVVTVTGSQPMVVTVTGAVVTTASAYGP